MINMTPLEGMPTDHLERVARWLHLCLKDTREELDHATRLGDPLRKWQTQGAVDRLRWMELEVKDMISKRPKNDG